MGAFQERSISLATGVLRDGWQTMRTKELVTVIVVGIVIVGFLALQALTASRPSVPKASTTDSSAATAIASAAPLSLDTYGPQVSLQDAKSLTGANFQLPQLLPSGLTLTQIRGEQDLAALIYSSPSLASLSTYEGNVSMIVIVMNDGTSYSFPSGPVVVVTEVHSCTSISISNANTSISSSNANYTISCTDSTVTNTPAQVSPTPVKLTVSGHPGWGVDYGSTEMVTWWSGGIHYEISASLPLQTLVGISQSMNT